MKLTKPQLDVLLILKDGHVHPTTTGTHGKYVAGTAAAALVRRGLAKHERLPNSTFFFGVQITEAGRALVTK